MSNPRGCAINFDSAMASTPITAITLYCAWLNEMRQLVAACGHVLERIENQANIVLSRARIHNAEP